MTDHRWPIAPTAALGPGGRGSPRGLVPGVARGAPAHRLGRLRGAPHAVVAHATRTGAAPTSRACTSSASRPSRSVDTSVLDAMRAQRDTAAPDAALVIDAPARRRPSRALTRCSRRGSSSPRSRRRRRSIPSSCSERSPPSASTSRSSPRSGTRCGVAARSSTSPAVSTRSSRCGSRTPRPAAMLAVFPTTVVLLDEGASLTVIDAYASPAGAEPAVQRRDGGARRPAATRASTTAPCSSGAPASGTSGCSARVLDANAKLRFTGITLGSRLQKVWWEVMLDGRRQRGRHSRHLLR